jgi:hypothetical protein
MSAPADQPQSPPLDPRVERRLARVEELAELAMGMARLVSEEAHAHPDRAGELSLQFARVAKAVRQTLMLEAHFCEPAKPISDVAPGGSSGQAHANDRSDDPYDAAGKQFETEMVLHHAFELEARDSGGGERLEMELEERMLDLFLPELFANDASLAEIITGICADLGIAPKWSDWSLEDWGPLTPGDRAELRAGARPLRPSALREALAAGVTPVDPDAPAPPDLRPALAEAP